LFGEIITEETALTVDKITGHLIDKYTIYANGNYSGMEFVLPENGKTFDELLAEETIKLKEL
jgi:hypothetical protein